MDFAGVLERISVFLEKRGFSHAVIGALGLHAYRLSQAYFEKSGLQERYDEIQRLT
jgi:hypothetical protein